MAEGAEELAASISRSAHMSDDRSFHVLEAVPNRLGASRRVSGEQPKGKRCWKNSSPQKN